MRLFDRDDVHKQRLSRTNTRAFAVHVEGKWCCFPRVLIKGRVASRAFCEQFVTLSDSCMITFSVALESVRQRWCQNSAHSCQNSVVINRLNENLKPFVFLFGIPLPCPLLRFIRPIQRLSSLHCPLRSKRGQATHLSNQEKQMDQNYGHAHFKRINSIHDTGRIWLKVERIFCCNIQDLKRCLTSTKMVVGWQFG